MNYPLQGFILVPLNSWFHYKNNIVMGTLWSSTYCVVSKVSSIVIVSIKYVSRRLSDNAWTSPIKSMYLGSFKPVSHRGSRNGDNYDAIYDTELLEQRRGNIASVWTQAVNVQYVQQSTLRRDKSSFLTSSHSKTCHGLARSRCYRLSRYWTTRWPRLQFGSTSNLSRLDHVHAWCTRIGMEVDVWMPD